MNAIRLVTEDAADPDNPNRTIRRQRQFDPLRGLLKRCEIEMAHWIAAERFRDCYALAEGAREGAAGGRLAAWQRCHYSARAADARAEVRSSIQAVGQRLGAVFVASVMQCQPIRAMERDLSMQNGSGPDRIRDVLDMLAQHQAQLGR